MSSESATREQYAVCYKCNEVIEYIVDGRNGDTTFPRGEWLAHSASDFIVTGIKTRTEADEILKDRRWEPK